MVKNERKFKELVLYLVSKFGERGVVETKLMKLLYFAEAEYFKAQKRTITGIDYFRNNFGPTPDARVLSRIYSNLGTLIQREKKVANKKAFTVFRVAKKDFTYKNLTEREKETIEKTLKLYGSLPTGRLITLSHFDPPYLAAQEKKRIDFKFVFYRKDSEQDFEEGASADEQKAIAGDISEDNLTRFFDYVGSPSA